VKFLSAIPIALGLVAWIFGSQSALLWYVAGYMLAVWVDAKLRERR